MNFYLLGALVVLASFGAASLAASAVLLAVWRGGAPRIRKLPSEQRARVLLALRLAPTGLGLAVSGGLILPAYLVFEPRATTEAAGRLVTSLAVAGLALSCVALYRLICASGRTARMVQAWSGAGQAIALPGVDLPVYRVETAAPVVALAGLRRPRLLIAGSVLDGCDPLLVSAMAAHELGHRRSADNLKRLAIEACADPLGALPAGREMLEAWDSASEEAADDDAIAAGARPEDLAEALLAVARLAPAKGFPSLTAAAAFYKGEVLERRVRRLVANSPGNRDIARRPRRAAVALWLLAGAWLLLATGVLEPTHHLIERAVASRGISSR